MLTVFTSKASVGAVSRRLAAVALVLWLAGVGCLFGCEMDALAVPAGGSQAAAEAESCPAFSGRDCCHKAEQGGGDALAGQSSEGKGAVSCCPLSGQQVESARKANTTKALPAEAGSRSFDAPGFDHSAQLTSYRAQVPDRGSTHLRCCVFLI